MEGEDLLHNSDSKITPFYNSRGENHPGRAGLIAIKGWNLARSHRSSGVISARSLDLRDSATLWIIYSWSFDPWEFASAAASQWVLYDVIYDLRRPATMSHYTHALSLSLFVSLRSLFVIKPVASVTRCYFDLDSCQNPLIVSPFRLRAPTRGYFGQRARVSFRRSLSRHRR